LQPSILTAKIGHRKYLHVLVIHDDDPSDRVKRCVVAA
jgi:hypothetical protein